MATGPMNQTLRQLQRLLRTGDDGRTDAQLLERFVAQAGRVSVRGPGAATRADGAGRVPARGRPCRRRRRRLSGRLPRPGPQGGLNPGAGPTGRLVVRRRLPHRAQGPRRRRPPARQGKAGGDHASAGGRAGRPMAGNHDAARSGAEPPARQIPYPDCPVRPGRAQPARRSPTVSACRRERCPAGWRRDGECSRGGWAVLAWRSPAGRWRRCWPVRRPPPFRPRLSAATVRAASASATAIAVVSAKVAALTEGAIKAMLWTKLKITVVVVLTTGLLFAGAGAAALGPGKVGAGRPCQGRLDQTCGGRRQGRRLDPRL